MRPGDVFAGRFRIDAQLGQGGMGAVYAATNVALGRPVALKVLLSHIAVREDSLRRFLREARASASIRHPNVIEILDVIHSDDGIPAIVMELLSGHSLAQGIWQKKLAVEECASLLVPVCSAVGTAHARGIIHRDLKPENIFLATDSGRVTPKVLDFGIAKLVDPLTRDQGDAQTNTGAVLGTPHYMAPEQAFGERGVDHRADIWSLGVILYEMLCGVRPFSGENAGQILRLLASPAPVPIEQVRPDLPPDVVALVRAMMQPNKAERVADLVDVVQILQAHTAVRAPDFPRAIQVAGSGDVPAISDRAAASIVTAHDSFAPTQIAPLESAPTVGVRTDPMSQSPAITAPALTSEPPREVRSSRWLLPVLVAAIAAGAVGFVLMIRRPAERAPEPPAVPAAAAPVEEHAVAPKVVAPAPSPDLPPAPSAPPKSTKPKSVAQPSPTIKSSTAPPPSAAAPAKGGLIEQIPF